MIKQRNTTVLTSGQTLTVSQMGDVLCNSASAQTYKMPAVSDGLWYRLTNIGTGLVTVTNPSDVAIKLLDKTESCLVLNDGTTWFALKSENLNIGDGTDSANNITVRTIANGVSKLRLLEDSGNDYGLQLRFNGATNIGYLETRQNSIDQNQLSMPRALDNVGLAYNTNQVAHIANAPMNKSVDNPDTITRIPQPIGGEHNTRSGAVTGWIRILLPQYRIGTMLSFWVDVYEYASTPTVTNTSFSLHFSGYCYTAGSYWLNVTAYAIGGTSHSVIQVVAGDNGSKSGIWIGNVATGANSTWGYPAIQVRDFIASFGQDSIDQWDDGWDIDITITDASTVAATIADARLNQ